MNITQIPFEEGRFYVDSRSRINVMHMVDLMGVDPPRIKPHATCTCEAYVANPLTKGHPCPHILAVAAQEKARLNL